MIVISAPDKLSKRDPISSRKKSNSPEREHGVRRRERHRDQIDEVPRPPILAVQEARPDSMTSTGANISGERLASYLTLSASQR